MREHFRELCTEIILVLLIYIITEMFGATKQYRDKRQEYKIWPGGGGACL